ncbi:PREDICTED: mitochondrial ubiquitin ligase activator of NFKB 1 isoform X1 [Rhinopithecus bieti]|uniref:mitochondrial ubiquitin ligase activator of NFKB 1 isoform X1 n=1 Tax=Rhinopithecus bieti TaxID=61621 RepID=UPI00083C9024|nr:PREDICTED: mitochondrial ubiquitin ligase activator of NFKB 1 isoform X1 [Rhinopithecus bieti]
MGESAVASAPRFEGDDHGTVGGRSAPQSLSHTRLGRQDLIVGRSSLTVTRATPPSGSLYNPLAPASGSGVLRHRWATDFEFSVRFVQGVRSWSEGGGELGVTRRILCVTVGHRGLAPSWRAEGGPHCASSSSWVPPLWSPPPCTPCTGRRPGSPKSSRNDCSKIIHQRTNTVPFDLVPHEDGVDVAVRVLKPLDSVDLGLETVYEKFHPSIQSFTDVIGHYISGERPKGIQETEEMLKVGATLTGVGELVLDNNSVRLQPPKQGMQYYLSSQDFDSLLQRQESSVRLWKVLALVFGFATCATLFFILRKQYLQRQERLRLKQMQEEFQEHEAQLLSRAKPEDRESLKSACVVCLSNFKSCVFLECGHVCSCTECYRALPEPKKCPICRQAITRVIPLYNS